MITGTHHHTQLIFVFLVEMGFHYVGQAGLELLTSGDLPASQSVGVTGMSHHAQPSLSFLHWVLGTWGHVGGHPLDLCHSHFFQPHIPVSDYPYLNSLSSLAISFNL